MRNLHLTDNFLAYVIPGIVAPFNVILVKTFVESLPASLQESAEIDGAGYFTVFTRIVFPLIKPILGTIAIFSAVGQWSSFTDTLFLMTDSRLFTLQYVLWQYLNEASSMASILKSNGGGMTASLANMQTPLSVQMTISMVVVLPILCVYPFCQRFFVKGIMMGAVKG
jgi:putative aldouronate transport system permease protein